MFGLFRKKTSSAEVLAIAPRNRSRLGFVRGHYYADYVEDVKTLRRAGHEVEAQKLLLELVDATEAEARANHWTVASWYYDQLAISYRKLKDPLREVQILERYDAQVRAADAMHAQPNDRLVKARARLAAAKAQRHDG